jgi:hypothetical protein
MTTGDDPASLRPWQRRALRVVLPMGFTMFDGQPTTDGEDVVDGDVDAHVVRPDVDPQGWLIGPLAVKRAGTRTPSILRQPVVRPVQETRGPSALYRSAVQEAGRPVVGSNATVMWMRPPAPGTRSRAV